MKSRHRLPYTVNSPLSQSERSSAEAQENGRKGGLEHTPEIRPENGLYSRHRMR